MDGVSSGSARLLKNCSILPKTSSERMLQNSFLIIISNIPKDNFIVSAMYFYIIISSVAAVRSIQLCYTECLIFGEICIFTQFT